MRDTHNRQVLEAAAALYQQKTSTPTTTTPPPTTTTSLQSQLRQYEKPPSLVSSPLNLSKPKKEDNNNWGDAKNILGLFKGSNSVIAAGGPVGGGGSGGAGGGEDADVAMAAMDLFRKTKSILGGGSPQHPSTVASYQAQPHLQLPQPSSYHQQHLPDVVSTMPNLSYAAAAAAAAAAQLKQPPHHHPHHPHPPPPPPPPPPLPQHQHLPPELARFSFGHPSLAAAAISAAAAAAAAAAASSSPNSGPAAAAAAAAAARPFNNGNPFVAADHMRLAMEYNNYMRSGGSASGGFSPVEHRRSPLTGFAADGTSANTAATAATHTTAAHPPPRQQEKQESRQQPQHNGQPGVANGGYRLRTRCVRDFAIFAHRRCSQDVRGQDHPSGAQGPRRRPAHQAPDECVHDLGQG